MSSKINGFSNGAAVLTALSNMKTLPSSIYDISVSSLTDAICIANLNLNLTITFTAPFGNVPQIGLWSSVVDQKSPTYYSTNRTEGILTLLTDDGRDDNVKLCNGIGKCDFSTGVCKCPPGWGFDAAYGVCGRYHVNTSSWGGLSRCPGVIDVTQIGNRGLTKTYDLRANYPIRIYISMNPIKTGYNLSAIYYFEWINDLFIQVDRGNPHFFLNLTSHISAGPIVLDSAKERIFFIDNNPQFRFIGIASQFDISNSNYTIWHSFTTPIYDLALDAHYKRRKLYWTVPGGVGLIDGGIYWAYADAGASPVVYSLIAAIGQVCLLVIFRLFFLTLPFGFLFFFSVCFHVYPFCFLLFSRLLSSVLCCF
jgi:hypothetical protein